MKYKVEVSDTGEYNIVVSNSEKIGPGIKEYEIQRSDGTGEYESGENLMVLEHEDMIYYRVMYIGKDIFYHKGYNKDYIVTIDWSKNCYSLTSLVFNMFISVKRYENLISGEEKEVDEKVLKFYFNTLKSLMNIEKSFPL